MTVIATIKLKRPTVVPLQKAQVIEMPPAPKPQPLRCEREVRGKRDKYATENARKKKGEPQQHQFPPYFCNQAAAFYRVDGRSFSCYATLCWKHFLEAQKEGFVLTEVRPL